jgi:signal transduction histidine kinase
MTESTQHEKSINSTQYPTSENEEERQKAVEKYKILDTLPEEEFDSLVELAALITESPMSEMNILSRNRQWTKAAYGIATTGENKARAESACTHTIMQDGNFEIKDLSEDDRFKHKSYVENDPHLKFYSGVPLKTHQGLNLGALCVLDTKSKELSETQRKALRTIGNEIISRLEIRRTQAQLEQLNREKDQFLRAVNHDIKSPLNGIISCTHFLQNHWDGDRDELNKMLSMVEISGQKLINYTSELVTNSLERGETELIVDETEVDELIEDLILIYTPLAEAKKIKIITNLDTSENFRLDTEKFKLIVSNLISNAMKFSQKGDTITIDVNVVEEDNERKLHCSVADTGIGIPDDFLSSLFVKNKKHQRQGTQGEISTGLGLPIVKQFVELHGGNIKVDTEVDEGATFHISIPEQE